jgi:hypothetical protein
MSGWPQSRCAASNHLNCIKNIEIDGAISAHSSIWGTLAAWEPYRDEMTPDRDAIMEAGTQNEDRNAAVDMSSYEHRATKLSAPRARQAAALGHMRYVLAIGLTLVIVAFAVIYFLYF